MLLPMLSRLLANRITPALRTQSPRRFTRSLGVILVAVLASCDSGSTSPNAGPNQNPASLSIGPQGGTFASADGSLTLAVPAGALAQSTTLTIAPLTAAQMPAAFAGMDIPQAYDLGPDGLTFSKPITVSLYAGPSTPQSDGSIRLTIDDLLTTHAGEVEPLDSLRVVSRGDSTFIVGDLRHFSPVVQRRKTGNGSVTFGLYDVPSEAEVGVLFNVMIKAVAAGISPAFLAVGERRDVSNEVPSNPVRRVGSVVEILAPLNLDHVEDSPQYRCESVGTGTISIIVIVIVKHPREDVGFDAQDVSAQLDRTLNCVAPAPPILRILTVVRTGSGSGTVTSLPAGISCGSQCSSPFDHGTSVLLMAAPASGSSFKQWSGACGGTETIATVTMDADRTCNAEFELIPNVCESTTPLAYGTSQTGAWGPEDCVRDERYVDRLSVTVTEQSNTIQLTSSSTAYVRIIGNGATINFGDPSPFTGTARVVLPPGTYVIEVMRTTAATGTYTVQVSTANANLDCTTREGLFNVTFTGQSLTSSDCPATSFHGAGSGDMRYDFVFLTAVPGQQINVGMTSTDFNPALIILYINESGQQTVAAVNSNAGNASNVNLSLVAQPGRYCIVFTSTGASRGNITGSYSASASSAAAAIVPGGF